MRKLLFIKNLLRRLVRMFIATRWNIGFIDIPTDESVLSACKTKKISWLCHSHKTRWFADPFILSASRDTIEVLVEEWVDEDRKGRISKLLVVKAGGNYVLKEVIPLLDLKNHLSFPFIYREGEKVFVVPENCASGSLMRYEYNEKFPKLIFDQSWGGVDAPMTDTIVVPKELSGENEVLLSTESRISDGPSGKILGVYKRSCAKKFVRSSEILFSDKSARCAGAIFQEKGKWIRPAQDCNKRYGHKLVFQEIEKCEDGFIFHELFRVAPRSFEYNLGIHTFNLSEDHSVAVVDGYCYRTPLVGRFLATFRIGTILAKLQSVRGR